MCLTGEDLSPIKFRQSLFCGMADCDAQTTMGLLERDERLPGLFRLLPICPNCLRGLRTGKRMRLRERSPDDPMRS
jgi:hypothetical protein